MNILPYFVTAASIVGTIANSFQKRWCFYVWLCTNAFWCIYNGANGSYAQAALYAFNFAMAILGLIKWRGKGKKRKTVRSTVKQINAALGIKLHKWQVDYIFRQGQYKNEAMYGRRNGKTLANVLKYLFSDGPELIYRKTADPYDGNELRMYAKEDGESPWRLRFFTQEVVRVYITLKKAGVDIPRKIIFKQKER